MRIVVAQINPTVGAIDANISRTCEILRTWSGQADLIVFPELYLSGYPPRDLLAEPWFIAQVQRGIERLVEFTNQYPNTGILFGAPTPNRISAGPDLFNSAILAHHGEIIFEQHKSLLPTYDVFDEARYFDVADEIDIVTFKGTRLGISICEDAWNDPELWPNRRYDFDPIAELASRGAELLINISASPFYLGKEEIRYRLIQGHARRHGLPFLFVNQVGGNDELIFDGRSMVFDKEGEPVAISPSFTEHIHVVDTKLPGEPTRFHEMDRMGSLYHALLIGIRDYLRKCGFKTVVLGLSGGIDSAVVATLAADAIGKENVLGITMPSPYSSPISAQLSHELASNLGIGFKEISIAQAYTSISGALRSDLKLGPDELDISLENLQARIRGMILMSFSNRFGHLVLSTGNKSELATGYCTLYGDMAGGLAVIADVPKTMVYELANYLNRETARIPTAIITRPPTAELKPNQRDQDTLPPYDILDGILKMYIEEHRSRDQIAAAGYDVQTVDWVIRTVNRNEYKRQQAAPALKVTTRSFGVGRRMPIAARYDQG